MDNVLNFHMKNPIATFIGGPRLNSNPLSFATRIEWREKYAQRARERPFIDHMLHEGNIIRPPYLGTIWNLYCKHCLNALRKYDKGDADKNGFTDYAVNHFDNSVAELIIIYILEELKQKFEFRF